MMTKYLTLLQKLENLLVQNKLKNRNKDGTITFQAHQKDCDMAMSYTSQSL